MEMMILKAWSLSSSTVYEYEEGCILLDFFYRSTFSKFLNEHYGVKKTTHLYGIKLAY